MENNDDEFDEENIKELNEEIKEIIVIGLKGIKKYRDALQCNHKDDLKQEELNT